MRPVENPAFLGYHGRVNLAELQSNLAEIRNRLFHAAARAGRAAEDIKLLAVTKTLERETVLLAYEAGLRTFGENRVKEAEEKYADLPEDLDLHLIGHLQTNKIKTAAGLFSCYESIDSFHTAEALNRRLDELGREASYLVEINVSGEASKSGYASFEAFLGDLEGLLALERLRLRGLMTVGPLTDDPEEVRRSFRFLKAAFEALKTRLPGLGLDVLSMGMSSDFEIAVEEGSTLVRIGTALFGSRA